MTTTPNHCVLFADMLGFKRLVLGHRTPFPENLEFRGRLVERPARGSGVSSGNPLSSAFRAFHLSVNQVLNLTTWHAPVSIVVFSDSMFLASTETRDCVAFAERLIRLGLHRDMPLRMGMAMGSFIGYGFSYEESPSIKYASSQFFGTGVVNSIEAEKCLKGIRIAVHPSAVTEIDRLDARQVMPVPTEEKGPNVSHELSYLPKVPDPMGDMELDTDIEAKILELQTRAPKVTSVQAHYSRSLEALGRMTAAAVARQRHKE